MIYMDECGSLGVPTRYVVGLIAIEPRAATKLTSYLKTISDSLSVSELKFSNANKQERIKILNNINKHVVFTGSIYFCTDGKRGFLINEILEQSAKEILGITIPHLNEGDTLQFIWDEGVRSETFEVFRKQIKSFAPTEIPITRIEQRDSKLDGCVQSADFIAGAMHTKHVKSDGEYWRIVKDKHQERIRKN